jgi:hypothetical protein
VIALLVIRAVGSLIGLVAWPGVMYVYGHANRAMAAASFAVNAFSALLAIWILWVAARRASEVSSPDILRRNAATLAVAHLAAIVLALELAFSCVALEANALLIVNVGNATEIDFRTGAWLVVVDLVVPTVLLVLALAASGRWLPAEKQG